MVAIAVVWDEVCESYWMASVCRDEVKLRSILSPRLA